MRNEKALVLTTTPRTATTLLALVDPFPGPKKTRQRSKVGRVQANVSFKVYLAAHIWSELRKIVSVDGGGGVERLKRQTTALRRAESPTGVIGFVGPGRADRPSSVHYSSPRSLMMILQGALSATCDMIWPRRLLPRGFADRPPDGASWVSGRYTCQGWGVGVACDAVLHVLIQTNF